jgi:hypothetical protein
MASIEVQGVSELIAQLGVAETVSVLRPPMQRAVYRLQAAMAHYPPQRAGSAYRRTGTLGRRWTTRIVERAGGLEGKVGNNTVYGPFVQSQMFQASVHRGRWQTDQQVLDEQTATITADFERAIEAALR